MPTAVASKPIASGAGLARPGPVCPSLAPAAPAAVDSSTIVIQEIPADALPRRSRVVMLLLALAELRGLGGLLLAAGRCVIENPWGWLTSLVVHAVALTVLEAVHVPGLNTPPPEELKVELEEKLPELVDIAELVTDTNSAEASKVEAADSPSALPQFTESEPLEGLDSASVEPVMRESRQRTLANELLALEGFGPGEGDQLGTGAGKVSGGFDVQGVGKEFGGRGARRRSAQASGATAQSEAGVEAALRWLAHHQLPDGGWSFAHSMAAGCGGQCPNSGSMQQARVAATSMALLPFLGAGHTPHGGQYRPVVSKGVEFLMSKMKSDSHGGSYFEEGGRMYSHGLAAIAICEAYGMCLQQEQLLKEAASDDPKARRTFAAVVNLQAKQRATMKQAAQAALNYVAWAQDPKGGGWRYQPRQAGDTSVVGWQIMALASGHLSELEVSAPVLARANRFLDNVQIDSLGAKYGYADKEKGSNATTAIGLLCRMYLGWPHDHPGLIEGIAALQRVGPRHGDMYYNYYATQVMHQYGGEPWEKWNQRMRDHLVTAQAKNGHVAGSWFFPGGDHGAAQGGRLYCTAMAAMTLEVYYRHMPLYRQEAFDLNPE